MDPVTEAVREYKETKNELLDRLDHARRRRDDVIREEAARRPQKDIATASGLTRETIRKIVRGGL